MGWNQYAPSKALDQTMILGFSMVKIHLSVTVGKTKIFRNLLRGTFKSKAPLRVQFSPALGEGGGGKGLKPKLLLGFTK